MDEGRWTKYEGRIGRRLGTGTRNVKDQPAETQFFRAQRASRPISARLHPLVLGRPSRVELRAGIGTERSIDMPPVEVTASVSLSYAEGVTNPAICVEPQNVTVYRGLSQFSRHRRRGPVRRRLRRENAFLWVPSSSLLHANFVTPGMATTALGGSASHA